MLFAIVDCGGSAPTTVPQLVAESTADTIAIVNVNVVPMDRDVVLAGQTILVAAGRIVRIGDRSTVLVPATATKIDGTGRYALPGLIDMHVHARTADLSAYVSSGITSARNMWGTSFLRSATHLTDDAIVPAPLSPALYSASPGVDGHPGTWPETRFLDDPADADTLVADLSSERWRFIKAYSQLSLASFDALIASAHRRNIRVVGHVPFSVSIEHALTGLSSIEHLTGYDRALSGAPGALAWANADTTDGARLAALTASAGVWNCPTLVVLENIAATADATSRTRAIRNRYAFIRQLHRAGARLLAGTDAGIDRTSPGVSLHDELEHFVDAGLTPYEALSAATTSAAEFLHHDDEIGALVVGRRADLVLLAANPLADIHNARRIDGVMLRGTWYRRP